LEVSAKFRFSEGWIEGNGGKPAHYTKNSYGELDAAGMNNADPVLPTEAGPRNQMAQHGHFSDEVGVGNDPTIRIYQCGGVSL
jgi:hypothetical protein